MSSPPLTFSVHDFVPEDAATVIGNGLDSANSAVAPLAEVCPVSVDVRNENNEIIGGATGRTWGQCCEIQQVWVHKAYRRQGIGRRLVSELHRIAESRGCRTFYLETFSFQSPQFYRSLGYDVRLELTGFGKNISKFVMVRQLPLTIRSLSTARLLLRPYQSSDFSDFAALNADEQVRRHVGGILTQDKAATLFKKFSAACLPGNEVWAVVLKDSGDYLGHCWFVQQGTDSPELGLLVAIKYWQQGYGIEIAQAMLDYAKNQASYRQVIATVDCDHVASLRLLERIGMKQDRTEEDDEGIHYVYSYAM